MSSRALTDNNLAGPSSIVHAAGGDWAVAEYICKAGPDERPFEERHNTFSIALVTEGTFRYRSQQGTSLLYPGALLLGNFGTCYECGHDHSTGDRCFAFHYWPALFEEIATSMTGAATFTFGAPTMPATAGALPVFATARNLDVMRDRDGLEETAITVLESVLGAARDVPPRPQSLSALDERRISEAIDLIDRHSAEALTLDGLSRAVSMSKYHFLRTFRRITGHSPHQYLLHRRLVRAAERLATTVEPVSAIAFDVGFGDLSTFNAQFRRAFREAPTRFRERHRRSATVNR